MERKHEQFVSNPTSFSRLTPEPKRLASSGGVCAVRLWGVVLFDAPRRGDVVGGWVVLGRGSERVGDCAMDGGSGGCKGSIGTIVDCRVDRVLESYRSIVIYVSLEFKT